MTASFLLADFKDEFRFSNTLRRQFCGVLENSGRQAQVRKICAAIFEFVVKSAKPGVPARGPRARISHPTPRLSEGDTRGGRDCGESGSDSGLTLYCVFTYFHRVLVTFHKIQRLYKSRDASSTLYTFEFLRQRFDGDGGRASVPRGSPLLLFLRASGTEIVLKGISLRSVTCLPPSHSTRSTFDVSPVCDCGVPWETVPQIPPQQQRFLSIELSSELI